MGAEQPADPDDTFLLEGKNLRRGIPQGRRNIDLQRLRVRGNLVAFLVCLALGILGCRSTGLWRGLGIVLLILTPFSLFGAYADHRLMRWHQQRLLECERRLSE